jgi:type II pantothenate kinase
MRTVIGIDIGGSTTKIVGIKTDENGKQTLIDPIFVRATDAFTSIYGAFGKFTMQNGIELSQIDRVLMTGVGSSFIEKPIYGLECTKVSEFVSVGLGGLYQSGLDEAIVVSMGTGTALIYAKRKKDGELAKVKYLGGTGVGGGTLVGLSRKMLGVENVEHIEQLGKQGDLGNVDLRIKDISADNNFQINEDITASNFGKLSDLATPADIARGISNMVAETIAMMAIFAARNYKLKNIILTGNLTAIKPIRDMFLNLEKNFDVNFIIPENSQFGTVIGAALCE